MTSVSPALVQKALRLLFSTESPLVTLDRIQDLDSTILRAAYRHRAMHFHPDRASALGVDSSQLEELFKRLLGAYRMLDGVVSRDIAIDYPKSEWVQPHPTRSSSPRHRTQSPQSRRPYAKSHAPAGKGYHRGPMPKKPLRFAQFLYYAGLIDWKTMIDAITWQMNVRPKIGEIGRAYQFFNYSEITDVIREREIGELFGNVALRMGKVTRLQLQAMIGKQKNLNLPIGRYFLEEELFNRPELETLLRKNRVFNAAAHPVR